MTDQTPTPKAQSLGWIQCDYPHKAAKDMWYHPDASICDDGRYVSEEEMLGFIDTPLDEGDFASILAKGVSSLIQRSQAELRQAWEAGFALCASYGDNKFHFRGEQKENNWKKFLDTLMIFTD